MAVLRWVSTSQGAHYASPMDFFQDAPELTDTWTADPALRAHLERLLPDDVLSRVGPGLAELGVAAATSLQALGERAESEQPRVEHYDPWGRRIDQIVVSDAWTALHGEQARLGLAAIPYEGDHGEHARLVQLAVQHLYGPSSAVYSCPVSMTDAAVRVLLDSAEPELRERVVPKLTSRAADAWTSGQWMTEKPGGSDVGRTETVARPLPDGGYALTGVKWFTSATTADCALALARTLDADGNGVAGSRGLGLYLVEMVDPRDGRRQIGDTIRVRRLKDKLGTKALPTAELDLDGAYATPVGPPHRGVKTISGMLSITRLWNAMSSASGLARAVQLALSYATRREVFGKPLVEQPLHRVTLAELQVDYEATLALVVRASQLTGRVEAGVASEADAQVLRALMPVTKLFTAKYAVAGASEALEAFGGAGYIENTGLPALLRNAQVLSIWEGTTNVLSLDLLRAAVREHALAPLLADVAERMAGADVPELAESVRLVASQAQSLGAAAAAWADAGQDAVEAGMRAFAMRVGTVYTAALLLEHAAHRLAKHDDAAAAVANRWVRRELGGPEDVSPDPTRLRQADVILQAPLATIGGTA